MPVDGKRGYRWYLWVYHSASVVHYVLDVSRLRISAIVDAHFSLIVDGETASPRGLRGGAQAPGLNVAQASTISLKRPPTRGVSEPVLGFD